MPADTRRPHGVAYTLTLHDPNGHRVFGIDNAHVSGPRTGLPAAREAARTTYIVARLCGHTTIAMRIR